VRRVPHTRRRTLGHATTGWSQAFARIRRDHIARYHLVPFNAECPRPESDLPGFCHHELVDPMHSCTLEYFQFVIASVPDSVVAAPEVDAVRRLYIELFGRRPWLYVIRPNGEIIVGPEDFGTVKHASLSGGEPVWAAGEMRIKANRVLSVDLQSGHYVMGRVDNFTDHARVLIDFTTRVFKDYCEFFGLDLLARDFQCVYL
jgi:hypothetical protein